MATELHVNAQAHAAPEQAAAHSAAAGGRVWISQNAYGPPVTQVKQSTPTSNNLYWMNVTGTSEGGSDNLDFIVRFKAGSPLQLQGTVFHFPGGYTGGISSPFGVPYWGGNPILGPATLTALLDGIPVGSVSFTVIA